MKRYFPVYAAGAILAACSQPQSGSPGALGAFGSTASAAEIDFVKQVQPILEFNCVACHREGFDKGGLRLETLALATSKSDSAVSLVPGSADKSPLYKRMALKAEDEDVMPPAKKGGPLPKASCDLIRDWINQGAKWPAGVTLSPKKVEIVSNTNELEVVTGIYKKIVANLKEKSPADMKAYTMEIVGTPVTFDMVPIPAGEFVMGSPASEKDRKPDEGPQHKVKIEPFWMGKCEVTWNEYELFMYPADEGRFASANGGATPYIDKTADGVARPTKPYVEMSFGMGKDGYPAISMTQHAANKYCEWLSARTGQFYRLPTEAEWEYACRAGTTTTYYFGDDASQLGDYAWYDKNSDFKYQKVGKKKPNPWGLYDMLGNAAEWTLDQYEPNYNNFKRAITDNPYVRQTAPYGQVVRGGSWDDTADKLRVAGRKVSDKSWKQQDPQLPKSIWYLTDAQFLGFRVVRPLKVPPADELVNFWNNGFEKE
jgi:formylglycine-generating enzyme required for sulfatase activity